MSVADVADSEVEEVAWDLDPLLIGDPSDAAAAVDAMLASAQQRADAFAERYAGHVAELDGPGLAEAMKELGDLQELVARAGSYAGLYFSTDTTDPVRGALFQRVQENATPIETKLLFFELEWAAIDDDTADGEQLRASADGARLLPPPPGDRAPLPALPALRARGEDPRREVADRPQRLGPAVRGADRRAGGDDGGRRRAGVARGRALAPALRRPLRARQRRRARHRRARARPAHARLRLQHAARRQDGRRPAARLPALAGEPQPRQRGLRRVGPGARHRRAQPLRGAAPLVPPEGAAARPRPPQGLRPHGRGHGREPGRPLARRARARAGLVLELLPRARRPRPSLPDGEVDRRPGAAGQARGRVLRLHGAVRAPVRDAQLDLAPPRRADARARARPRRPRGARRAARASSTWRRR